jgi:glycosyltransferase involved in cell wall biosynthesis
MASPAVVDPQRTTAHRLLQSGAYQEAIQLLDALLKKQPDDPDLLNDAALAHNQHGEPAKAEKYLRRALGIQPDHEPAFYNLLDVLTGAHKYLSACKTFETYAPGISSSRERTQYRKRLGIQPLTPQETRSERDLDVSALRTNQVRLNTEDTLISNLTQNIDHIEDWCELPSEPLVSVCILAYNHENFITEAVEGALMQKTDYDCEIIIAEDRSTDRTRRIVQDFQEKYPGKIRLLLAKRNLYSINRHLPVLGTLSAARGKYIALCEGDDYWTDELKLQKQTDYMEAESDSAICFTSALFKYEEVRREPFSWPDLDRSEYSFDDIIRENFIPTCTAILRNKLINSIPGWLIKEATDSWWPLYVLAAEHGDIGYIGDVSGVRRKHQGAVYSGLSQTEQVAHSISNLEIYLREYGHSKSHLIIPSLINRYRSLFSAAKESERDTLANWAKLRHNKLKRSRR